MTARKTEPISGTARSAQQKPLPPSSFEASCRARPDIVYGLLADLRRHLEWAGERQSPTTRLLTMDAPMGLARVGTEFVSSGSDGKVARWHDHSLVTEASPPHTFEFVTEGVRTGKPESRAMRATTVHRYEVAEVPGGCRVVYVGEVTRSEWFPGVIHWPVIGRLILKASAKYMRKGFDGLIALAEEEAA